MASSHAGGLLRFVRNLATPARAADTPDAQLLRQFAAERDEGAFVALVRRHGPMVLGVCRRVLDNPQDAEDAFQAAFLVLARRVRSIARPEQLGNWLYGVAYRTALEAKRAARRRLRERQVRDVKTEDPADAVLWADLRPVLDEEINRLSEKYRAPFVLCYLEGRTNEEAAQLLGCPRGTILSRLARARETLRTRLTRRGITLSGGALVAALTQHASAAVPHALAGSTARAAVALAASAGTLSPLISADVATLLQKVLAAMTAKKLGRFLMILTLSGLLAVGAALGYAATEPGQEQVQPAAPAPDRDPQPRRQQPARFAKVEVERLLPLDARGKATVSDRKTIAELASFFPGLGEGKRSDIAGGWKPGYRVTFLPAKGEPIKLGVHFDGTLWSEGQGDWRAKAGLKIVLDRLFADGAGKGMEALWGEVKAFRSLRAARATRLAFLPEGKRVVLGSSQVISTLDLASGKEVPVPQSPRERAYRLLRVSPKGHLLVARLVGKDINQRPDGIRVTDLTAGKELGSLATGDLDALAGMALSPDGRTLAVTCPPTTVTLWDLPTGKQLGVLEGRGGAIAYYIHVLVFSPDGKQLAAGSGTGYPTGGRVNGAVGVWDVRTRKLLRNFPNPESQVNALAFSPDGMLLAGGGIHSGKGLRLWEVKTGKERSGFKYVGNNQCFAIVFSPDGKTLAVNWRDFGSGDTDAGVALWEVATGRLRGLLKGPRQTVEGLAFSPDGRRLAAMDSLLGTLWVWEAAGTRP